MMKMNFKRNCIVVLAAFAFVGCFTDEIRPDLLIDYQEKIVVNAVIDADQNVSIELTDSRSVLDSNFYGLVDDAVVELTSVNGTDKLTFDLFSEQYILNKSFVSGSSLSLSISHPDLPNARSVIRIPDNIDATSDLVVEGATDSAGNKLDVLQISFSDEAQIENYYKINVYYFSTGASSWIPLNFDKSDPSLADYNSYTLNDAGVLFADDLFNGKDKTISMVMPFGLVSSNPGDKYRIDLSSISKDYFKYYTSLQRAQDAKEITFNGGYNNAVVIHSNIDGGLGILGAQSTSINTEK